MINQQLIFSTFPDLDEACGNLLEAAISNEAQAARFATHPFCIKGNTGKNIPDVDKGIEQMEIALGNTTIAEFSNSDNKEWSSNLDIIDRTDLSNLPDNFSLRVGDLDTPLRTEISYSELIKFGGNFGQSESIDTTTLKTICVSDEGKQMLDTNSLYICCCCLVNVLCGAYHLCIFSLICL